MDWGRGRGEIKEGEIGKKDDWELGERDEKGGREDVFVFFHLFLNFVIKGNVRDENKGIDAQKNW